MNGQLVAHTVSFLIFDILALLGCTGRQNIPAVFVVFLQLFCFSANSFLVYRWYCPANKSS